MKFISVLITVLCFSLKNFLPSSECHNVVARGAGSLGTFAAEKIIEKIQSRMRYGFPVIGISPLAPLKLKDRNTTINFSFLQFNSSLNNILIDGIDRFRINYVKFSWRNKSMNFSLTFTNLRANGSFEGNGNFINYVPLSGVGNYCFDVHNFTTNVVSFVSMKRLRMQIANFTAASNMEKFKSNITGLRSDNRWTTRSINKIMNRLIELATPRIFDLNQRLFNYVIANMVVPRINKILTMFSVLVPSIKIGNANKQDDTVYFRELDDASILKYIRQNPFPPILDDEKLINILFNEKFYGNRKKS